MANYSESWNGKWGIWCPKYSIGILFILRAYYARRLLQRAPDGICSKFLSYLDANLGVFMTPTTHAVALVKAYYYSLHTRQLSSHIIHLKFMLNKFEIKHRRGTKRNKVLQLKLLNKEILVLETALSLMTPCRNQQWYLRYQMNAITELILLPGKIRLLPESSHV